jgi:Sulfotransferase family
MADATRRGWIHSIRNFVLDGAKYARPRLGPDHYLVVKEPNGSVGAPLLMEALPESRLILLIRDPRDVVSSTLDGARKGNWLYERKDRGGWKRDALPDNNPDAFTRRWANVYMQHAGNAKKAYDAHKGPKVMVRYEDLRADTIATMRRIYSTLRIPVNEGELVRAVEKHSWENIPEKKKGGGKFYRKAMPGGWQEDLTPRQIEQVERITAPLLEEYYSSEAP